MCVVACFMLVASLFLVIEISDSQLNVIKDDGYEITNYNIEIVVNEDRSMDISEEITAYFYEESHGITRYLPIYQTVSFFNKNGKQKRKTLKNDISNFRYYSSLSSEDTGVVDRETVGNNEVYYIGNADSYIVGEQKYVFSYDFDAGNDRVSSMDLFYFNIVGNGWTTDIKNITFSIRFPTSIEAQQFDFYVGKYGEDQAGNSSRVSTSVSGKTIYGQCLDLDFEEALTIYTEFEEGYFKFDRSFFVDILLAIVLLTLLIAVIIFFLKKRKKEPVVEVVEFKAPEGLTPTEVGYINDGEITGDDISALVVYWASKGYVRLVEKDDDIIIERLTETIPNFSKHEKIFFTSLFANGNSVNAKEMNNDREKRSTAGYECAKEVKNTCKKYFNFNSDNIFVVFVTLAVALFGIVLLKNYWQAHISNGLTIVSLIMFLMFAISSAFLDVTLKKKYKLSKKKFALFLSINLFFVFAPVIVAFFLLEGYCDPFGIRILFAIIPILLAVIYLKLERYTKEGRDILGRIRGLKNYIGTAEKDRMEMLVKENPSLFYEILPYAYVLGVSDVYMEKFKDIDIVQPEWFVCEGDFFSLWVSMRILNKNLNIISYAITKSILQKGVVTVASAVSKFSGGGGSFGGGGGFSGGGSGGGGGGRW